MRQLTLFIFVILPFWLFAQVDTPVFSKQAGFYTGSTMVELTAPQGCVIRYTLNGDSVTSVSFLYQTKLTFNSTKVLRARCFSQNNALLPSEIVTKTYLVNENMTLPVLSITMAPYHLWDNEVGIYVAGTQVDTCNFYPYPCANYWQRWVKPAYVEYFDANKQQQVAQNVGIEITGGWSKANPKKGLLVQFDHDDFGDGKVNNWPLMPDKPHVTTWKNLHLRPSSNGVNNVFAFDAWLEKAMKTTNNDYIAYQPAHILLNGAYWGIYELRERQDKHFLRYNYGLDKDSVDILRFPESSDFYGNTNYYAVQGGTDSLWKKTVRILDNADPKSANFYSIIDQEFDLANYIDYFIVQTFIGNNDWIGPWYNNIRVWRPQTVNGKWRYMLWDLDGALGEQWDARYTPCFNNINYARNPDEYTLEHSWMFDKMCRNKEFQHRYAQRFTELINTILTPKHLTNVADTVRMELNADIARNFTRWEGMKSDWWAQYDKSIDWAEKRQSCVNTDVARAMVLKGAITLNVKTQPLDAGLASVAMIEDIVGEWKGYFFRDFPVKIGVEAKDGWIFSHWGAVGDVLDNPKSLSFEQNFEKSTTLTAYFIPKEKVQGFKDGAALYPNPANQWVFVQSDTPLGKCFLRDALGRLVLSFETEENYGSFDVEGLADGVYWLETKEWSRALFKI
jgi:hypothetical protein